MEEFSQQQIEEMELELRRHHFKFTPDPPEYWPARFAVWVEGRSKNGRPIAFTIRDNSLHAAVRKAILRARKEHDSTDKRTPKR